MLKGCSSLLSFLVGVGVLLAATGRIALSVMGGCSSLLSVVAAHVLSSARL